ncbi:MAG TPA: crosslink repair DNA glycosylase YcaQ family protein [Pyrinomonadaceae bacterium]
MVITIDDLRRFTVARNFPKPGTLNRVLQQMGFVQADPIRAPARAQDLILRHRVKSYHAGELERRYPTLDIEEDFFVNYGYVTRSLQTLMHPRSSSSLRAGQRKKAKLLLEFVNERGVVHPREVDEHFAHGRVTNYWGGSSNATTHLLDAMHYAGLLRIVRREKGIRIYAAYKHAPVPHSAAERRTRVDALVDVLVRIYAPLPGASLSYYVRRLRWAVPQWQKELPSALTRARQRLSHARIEDVDWYWPSDEDPAGHGTQDVVRQLAPFDPVVHDRDRFELFWNWSYRFEAYTPAAKRKLGYYAMPLLWRDRVIGWANLSIKNNALDYRLGFVGGSAPDDRKFKRELDAELERVREFLLL